MKMQIVNMNENGENATWIFAGIFSVLQFHKYTTSFVNDQRKSKFCILWLDYFYSRMDLF